MKKVSKQLPWKLFGFWSLASILILYFLAIEEGKSLQLKDGLSLAIGLAP